MSLHGLRPEAAGLETADAADVEAAVALAAALATEAARHQPRAARRRADRLTRLFDDPAGLALSLALTDQVARITRPDRAVSRLADLVATIGSPSFLGPLDRAALWAGTRLGRWAPAPTAAAVRWRLRRESAGIVLPAEDPAFARHLARRRAAGVTLNINVLGEAILGEGEARRRRAEVRARIERPDVDHVSVKVSSVCAQVSSLAFDRSVDRVTERLRDLFRAAAGARPPVFVTLDMEEHRDLALTVAVFTRLLDEPDLAGLDAGLALQAYLPDSHAAFEELAPWAVRRHARAGGRTKVRLVKGANLAMERVDAELHGWPQAPYTTKAEVDASYKRLLDRALDPAWGDAVLVGLASHNLFDVAWGMVRAARLGATDRLELEMLEGMAPGEAEAVRRRAGGLLLYAPVVRRDEFDAAIAYLVRRLDENTGPENFLRHAGQLDARSLAFAAERDRFTTAVGARHDVAVTSRRTQDRATEAPRFSLDEPFANEPDTDWSVAANRAWLAAHLSSTEWLPAEGVPLSVGDDTVLADAAPSTAVGIDPSRPGQPLYRWARADKALVERAVATARAAGPAWGAASPAERARALEAAAESLARHRGEALAVMAHDAGKTAAEGDPEVSEAVDLARYYARQAVALTVRPEDADADAGPRARPEPVGPVVVAPPWNFPLAIPAGGVFAALAAGNPVILKPAPETVLTAWRLACWCWEAGVPSEVLQFLPCPDDEVGRALVTHPDVGAVVLTGSLDTARMFLSWQPSLRLHAETSGKNAIVVTAAADLDLAVRDVVRSAFGHAGQKCSATSLAIVEQSVLDDGRFLAKLADATESLHVGPAWDPAVDVGPLIAPPNERLHRALHHLEAGESWLVEPHQRDDAGHLWSPGIRLGVAPGSFLHRTECFGPVLGVMAARHLDHAVELQNATAFGLTGGLHSLDEGEVARWQARVQVGNAYVNRSTTGAIVRRQPFGGWKGSAVGPTVKAGGPRYVASLCRWSDGPGLDADTRAAEARRRWPAVWAELARPQDPSGLRAERNELRLLPLPAVDVWVGPGAEATDVELCRQAAAVTGTPVTVIDASATTVEDLAARWGGAPPARLRVLGSATDELRRCAHVHGVVLDEQPPVADGPVELPRWAREQTVSLTDHRHGNTR